MSTLLAHTAGSGIDSKIKHSTKKSFAFDDLLLRQSDTTFSAYIERRKSNTAPNSPYSNSQSNCYKLSSPTSSLKPHLIENPTITSLPSLRHLKLLPDPKLQEFAYKYPDTSETTPYWKSNLLHWCREKNYNDYVKIVNETLYDRSTNTRNNQPSNSTTDPNNRSSNVKLPAITRSNTRQFKMDIPSVLKPMDPFENLANSKPSDCYLNISPMTPPMSPNYKNEQQKLSSTNTSIGKIKKFNPIISPKLIQLVKETKKTSTPFNTAGHKKSNSFKAIELKKILENRNLLNYNTRPLTNLKRRQIQKLPIATTNRVTKPLTNSNTNNNTVSVQIANITSSRSRSISPIRNSVAQDYNQTTSNELPYSGQSTPRATSPIRSNPVTPIIENSKYDYESPITPPPTKNATTTNSTNPAATASATATTTTIMSPTTATTPVASNSNTITTTTTTTKIKSKSVTPRRRSNGSPGSHIHIRKCVSCHSSDSPCWRPSWSGRKHDQLCNSCGLRYKKTRTRCLNDNCRKIPTKSELTIMKSNDPIQKTISNDQIIKGYRCLFCNDVTETSSSPTQIVSSTTHHQTHSDKTSLSYTSSSPVTFSPKSPPSSPSTAITNTATTAAQLQQT